MGFDKYFVRYLVKWSGEKSITRGTDFCRMQAFVTWLAGQPDLKSPVSTARAAWWDVILKDDRLEMRHQALLAFFNLAGARAGAAGQLPRYMAHIFRKTLACRGKDFCIKMTDLEAWSMTLGQKHLATKIGLCFPE
ncbi:MAG: hypothetical protein AAFM92_10510 [Pseudomonadota bacterium]